MSRAAAIDIRTADGAGRGDLHVAEVGFLPGACRGEGTCRRERGVMNAASGGLRLQLRDFEFGRIVVASHR